MTSATGPPDPREPQERATTASSTKKRAVAALTTNIPIRETFMDARTLTESLRHASAPLAPPVRVAGSATLALDLGSVTGWALRIGGDPIRSGTVSFRPSRYDGGGMRYLRFRGWLERFAADAGEIAAIYHEEIRRHLSTDAAHVHGGLLATLTAWCEQQAIPYQGVPVGTIKRFITGKGNADKAAVIAAVKARGYRPADDNEADAIAILLWAIETGGGVR